MVKSESHIPKLRFKGFSDVWQKQPLGNQFKLKNGFAFKSEYFQEQVSHIEVLTPGSVLPGGGYQDGKSRYYSQNGEIPQEFIFKSQDIFITLTDLTPSAQALGYPAFVPKNDKIYLHNQRLGKVCDNKANDRFLLNLLCTDFYHKYVVETATGTTVKHSSAQNILKYEASFPNLEEQTQIGNFFQKIDQVIELQQKALDTARDYKKSMLQKMFPQKGEKVPQIRFDGFSGDWGYITLNQVIKSEFKGKAQFANFNIGDNEYLDAERLNGGTAQLINLENDVDYNDILVLWDGSKAGTIYSNFRGVLGSTLKCYKIIQDYSPTFIYQFLKSQELIIFNQYRTPNIPHVVKNFSEIFIVPRTNYSEQQKIGEFFQKLDQRIEQHEKKLESYQNLKKAMLQRLFV